MNRQFSAFGGLAILLIVLNHSVVMMPPLRQPGASNFQIIEYNILYSIGALGCFGVPLFYFISGAFFGYAAKS